MPARTGREAGGNGDFPRGGLGVSPYPRRIQRPLKSITAPAAKYCMGRCKVFHRTLKTCSSAFSFRNCLIIGKLLLLAKVRKNEDKTKRKPIIFSLAKTCVLKSPQKAKSRVKPVRTLPRCILCWTSSSVEQSGREFLQHVLRHCRQVILVSPVPFATGAGVVHHVGP